MNLSLCILLKFYLKYYCMHAIPSHTNAWQYNSIPTFKTLSEGKQNIQTIKDTFNNANIFYFH